MLNKRTKTSGEIYPDEILLDAHNLPSFNKAQLEGELERPIARSVPWYLCLFCIAALLMLSFRVGSLQLVQGADLRERSQKNTLRHAPAFAARGIISDRNGRKLAWNDGERKYIELAGFGHVLGYVGYPREKDIASYGYDPKEFIGIEGAERSFNQTLQGEKGMKLVEVDALGVVKSEAVNVPSRPGDDVKLSIDARLQRELAASIQAIVDTRQFTGGAGVIMDVNTGELLALTNYPEYEPGELAPHEGDNSKINSYFEDKRQPFLNRAVQGLYTPGSVVKPIIALGALEEGVITPSKQILSTGELRVPNPYNPGEDSVFKDWRAHGWVDMRHAIAVSSDVYFYEIGGGFGKQPGIGIANIEKYSRLFGLAEKTGIELGGEAAGTIPSPEWKAEHFNGEAWRVGDTYHTAIGQYGYQITPLQLVRAIAAIANGGMLLQPQLVHASSTEPIIERKILISEDKFKVVREGMRMATEFGTATGLQAQYVTMGAKTGTAELGTTKSYVNSWVTGFFPYEHPRYAFVVVMERGKRANTIGAVAAMRRVMDWMAVNAPEYLK